MVSNLIRLAKLFIRCIIRLFPLNICSQIYVFDLVIKLLDIIRSLRLAYPLLPVADLEGLQSMPCPIDTE